MSQNPRPPSCAYTPALSSFLGFLLILQTTPNTPPPLDFTTSPEQYSYCEYFPSTHSHDSKAIVLTSVRCYPIHE